MNDKDVYIRKITLENKNIVKRKIHFKTFIRILF